MGCILWSVIVFFQSPDDVKKMGIDKYNAECRKIVMRYAEQWKARACEDVAFGLY